MAIDYAKAYQTFIDEELAQQSATEWMTATGAQVRFSGGKEVEIASLSTSGLGNYDSTKTDGTAYPSGSVTSEWQTHTLSMDRGVSFSLDRMAPSDSGFIATAENVIREFARTQLVKEQDTYRINKLYKTAAAGTKASTHVLTMAADDSLVTELCDLVQVLESDCERTGGFVALVSSSKKNEFLSAKNDSFNTISFEQSVEINGIVLDHVMMLNDIPCIFVPEKRMQTAIVVQTGRGSGDALAGGIGAAEASKGIEALVVAYDGPIAVSKIDSLKQFGPEQNQLFDGTSIQARYLYDLFVPENKADAIGALVSA